MNKFTRTKRSRAVTVSKPLIVAVAMYSACASSAEIASDFSLGAGYTDNINRVSTGAVDETIANAGMSLAISQTGPKVNADVRSRFTYYDYLEDTNESELVSAVDALVDISLVQERVRWLIQENYGRALFDPFQPDRPENWENVNFLTTGPTIILYQSLRNEAGIDLRYSQMDYETRPFDNDRQNARFWIGRQIRRDHMLSINADVEKIKFDNDGLTPDYERRSAYLRYEIDAGRNLFDIDVGYTEQEILSDTSDGIMFDISWTRTVSSRSDFTLHAGRRFADQGNVFRYQRGIARDVDSVGDITENGSPFLLEMVDVGYTVVGERTTLFAGVGASEQEYETQGQQDRTDAQVNLFVQRDLSRSVFAAIDLRHNRREFTNIQRDDETSRAFLTLGYRLSAAFSLSLSYSYMRRESSAVTDDFDENRGDLTLIYTPAWGRY